jgi:hypothetical protein
MATDQTEVPIRTIVGIGLLSIASIVGVHYGVWSYFHMTYGEAQRVTSARPSWTLERARETEARELANIGPAMERLASAVGTDNRPPQIAPRPSTDLQPLQGWGLRPRVVPNPPPAQGDLPAGAEVPVPSRAPTTPTAPTAAPVVPAAPVVMHAPAGAAH